MKSKHMKGSLAVRFSAALVALSLPAAAQFTFDDPKLYPAGSDPHDVAVADFDGDGYLDLVTSLHSPPRLSVLRNYGDGSFGRPEFTDLPLAASLQGVIAADFDADGLADIAVSSEETGTLIILHNLGNANFSLIAQLQVGIGPTEIAVGDMDGDLDLDLAVSNTLGNSVAIVHNQGFGQFQLVQEVAVGVGPKALDFGRFFGSGVPDLVVAVHDSHAVYVLDNDGSGSYAVQLQLSAPASTHPECVAVADFDEDYDDDLVTTFSEGTLNKLAIFYQLSQGNFSPAQVFNVGAYHPSHVVAADFDLDTRADVAVVSSNSGALSMLRNLGGGAFGFQLMIDLPTTQSDHMQAADLDGDYSSDLVVTNDGGRSLTVILNARSNPSTYCLAVPNSTGAGASIASSGSPSLAAQNLKLVVTNAPPLKTGVFFYSYKPTQLPFLGAYLCIAPPIRRLDPPVLIDGNGVASYAMTLSSELVGHRPLYVLPGTVLNFQLLYRDTRNVGWPHTNLSDGLRVVFTP